MLIECYTDGSACVRGTNKGKGGFAAFFPELENEPKLFSAGYLNTKTGRMEIMALIYSIRAINVNTKCTLKVYSDSEYVVKSFTEKRIYKWAANNWISYGNEIKNVDLWKKVLYELKLRPNLTIMLEHVKAHRLDKIKCPNQRKYLLQDKRIMGNYIADKFANYKRFDDYNTDLI